MSGKRSSGVSGPLGPRAILTGGWTGKYDEAEFLVGGRGTGPGETEKLTFKIHEGYLAEGERLLKSGHYPYKSMSDMGRHAWVRHIQWLQTLEPEETEGSVLHQLAQIDEVVAEEEFNIRFMSNIEATDKMVKRLRKFPNSKQQIGRVLRRCKARIDRMKDGFWKGLYEVMFMETFGALLNDGLVLVSIEGEDDSDSGIVDAELPE